MWPYASHSCTSFPLINEKGIIRVSTSGMSWGWNDVRPTTASETVLGTVTAQQMLAIWISPTIIIIFSFINFLLISNKVVSTFFIGKIKDVLKEVSSESYTKSTSWGFYNSFSSMTSSSLYLAKPSQYARLSQLLADSECGYMCGELEMRGQHWVGVRKGMKRI